jgi:acetyl esterase
VPLEPRVARMVRLMRALDRRDPATPMAVRRRRSAEVSRRFGWLVMPKGPEPASTIDHTVPVAGGRITVRVHTPHGPGPFPLYVFLHGGGWCSGTVDERDPRCRAISAGARCVVASVDYRLAPENAHPTPVEDCYAALLWLVEHADELGVDAERVAIGGESAGANLAAAVCLMARDRNGPGICHQWLDVPAVDLTLSQPSIESVPDGHLLDRSAIDDYLACFLTDPAQATDPYASPLHAEDLSGLPPAWITGAEYDKLRDDSVAYAAALEAAGVPVRHQILAGHVHPSFAFTRIIPSSAAYEREAIAALARALRT